MIMYLALGTAPTGKDRMGVLTVGHQECLVSFADMSLGKTSEMDVLLDRMDEACQKILDAQP